MVTIVVIGLLIGGIVHYKDKILAITTDVEIKGVVVENVEKTAEPAPVAEKPTPVIETPELAVEPVQEAEPVVTTEPTPEENKVAEVEEPKEVPVVEAVSEPEPEPEPVVKVMHGCTVAQSGLKVRAGASVDTELIGTAPYMSYIELHEKSEDGLWWKTTFDGKVGYMYARYIRVVDNPEACK